METKQSQLVERASSNAYVLPASSSSSIIVVVIRYVLQISEVTSGTTNVTSDGLS